MMRRLVQRARRGRHDGFTLVELLLGIILMTIFGAALYAFLQMGMTSSATEQSQAIAQQQGRDTLARMARDLRQASKPDNTRSGIEQITPTSMTLYVDNALVDASAPYTVRPWRVRYRISGTDLIREVATPVGSTPPYTYGAYTQPIAVVNGIANTTGSPAMFVAVDASGASMPATVVAPDTTRIDLVKLTLQIRFKNGNTSPTAEFSTDVAPRNPTS